LGTKHRTKTNPKQQKQFWEPTLKTTTQQLRNQRIQPSPTPPTQLGEPIPQQQATT
jgi:hypothetical protein